MALFSNIKKELAEEQERYRREDEERDRREEAELSEVTEKLKKLIEDEAAAREGSMLALIKPLKEHTDKRRETSNEKRLNKAIDEVKKKYEKERQEVALQRQKAAKRRARNQRRKKMLIFGVIIFVILCVAGVILVRRDVTTNKKNSEQYAQAVKEISFEDYDKAEKILDGWDYEDSKALLDYCKLLEKWDDFVGDPGKLKDGLEAIDGITSKDVKAQYTDFLEAASKAEEIQKEVDDLDVNKVTELMKSSNGQSGLSSVTEKLKESQLNSVQKQLDQIEEGLDGLNEHYRNLVNTDAYEKVKKLLQ